MDGTDYNRPRRPNADTLTYLKSLPLNEKLAHEEIAAYIVQHGKDAQKEDTNNSLTKNKYHEKHAEAEAEAETEQLEYPQIFSAAMAALDEIKNEIASLAGDEFGSQCVETIARITAPYSDLAARKLLYGVAGYMIHLSTHRYGSHVIQTILQSINSHHKNRNLKDVDIVKMLELDEEDEEYGFKLPSLKDLVLSLSDEIRPVSKDLAVHICGSHVLRSILITLGGCVEVVPDHLVQKSGGMMETGLAKRGKAKTQKKKKKNKTVMMADSVGNNASFSQLERVETPRIDANDRGVQESLFAIVQDFTSLDLTNSKDIGPWKPGHLQQLVCNPSAGPLLLVLVKLVIHLDKIDATDATDDELLTEQERANKSISDFRLGVQPSQVQFSNGTMAERLVKRILCWKESSTDDDRQEIAGDIIYGFAGETRGSHMVETILRASNDSFYEMFCNAGKFFEPETFKDYARNDVSNFIIQTLLNTARTRDQVEKLIKCVESLIEDGYVLDLKNRRRGIFWRAVEMSAKFRIGQETIIKCMRKGFGVVTSNERIEIEECIKKLINLQIPQDGKRFLELDATGARAVYQLLRFVPRLCGDTLSGIISSYDASELETMCNDGLASKCIIDGILDGPTNIKPFSQAVKRLFDKLKGRWVALSVHRVGHHTVKKIFKKLTNMEDRASLSKELADGINRLNGNAIGRSIILDCAVKDYMEGEEVWNNAVKKLLEKESFLEEILKGDVSAEKKRKRKRKKGGKSPDEEQDSKKVKS